MTLSTSFDRIPTAARFAAILIIAAVVCEAGAAELDYRLVWSDEFDGMDHANPFGANGWFTFDGSGGGAIGGWTTDLPPGGCNASLVAGRDSGRYSSVGRSTAGERSLADLESRCPVLTVQGPERDVPVILSAESERAA